MSRKIRKSFIKIVVSAAFDLSRLPLAVVAFERSEGGASHCVW